MSDIKTNLQLLDDILSALHSHTTHTAKEQEIKGYIKQRKNQTSTRSKRKNEKRYELIDSADEFGNALDYLTKEGMIIKIAPYYKITYKGIMKISKQGYIGEYAIENAKHKAMMAFWEWSPAINLISLFLAVLALMRSCN